MKREEYLIKREAWHKAASATMFRVHGTVGIQVAAGTDMTFGVTDNHVVENLMFEIRDQLDHDVGNSDDE